MFPRILFCCLSICVNAVEPLADHQHEPPLEPAPLMLPGAPPPRPRAQIEKILGPALTAVPASDGTALRIVLCASEKDKNHLKPGLHDYPLWRSRWTRLLNLAPGITAEPATDWPTNEQWERANVVAIYSHNPAWSAENDPARIAARAADLDRFLARGGGLVVLHYAVHGGAHADVLAERLGWASGKKIQVRMGADAWVLDQTHPLAAGIAVADFPDESYWDMTPGKNQALLRILATSVEDAAPRPQMWTRDVGPGRVFVSIPGHSTWTFDDPLFRILVLRGMMWSAGQPMDRLAALTVIGARMQD